MSGQLQLRDGPRVVMAGLQAFRWCQAGQVLFQSCRLDIDLAPITRRAQVEAPHQPSTNPSMSPPYLHDRFGKRRTQLQLQIPQPSEVAHGNPLDLSRKASSFLPHLFQMIRRWGGLPLMTKQPLEELTRLQNARFPPKHLPSRHLNRT